MSSATNRSETLDAMSALMTRFATGDRTWATAIPRLSFIRYSTPHQPMPAHHPPCFCLITQGSKSIAFGDDQLAYASTATHLVPPERLGGVVCSSARRRRRSSRGTAFGIKAPGQFSREYRRGFGTSSGADHRQLPSARTAVMA
jgi:hypothetical protein